MKRFDEAVRDMRDQSQEREFFIDNLLVRIHFIIVMIRWTGLAPWEFELPFPGSLTSTFLHRAKRLDEVVRDMRDQSQQVMERYGKQRFQDSTCPDPTPEPMIPTPALSLDLVERLVSTPTLEIWNPKQGKAIRRGSARHAGPVPKT